MPANFAPETITFFRALAGAPLLVLVALAQVGQPAGQRWICDNTLLGERTVSRALHRLETLGLIRNLQRYDGWVLTARASEQLPLFLPHELMSGYDDQEAPEGDARRQNGASLAEEERALGGDELAPPPVVDNSVHNSVDNCAEGSAIDRGRRHFGASRDDFTPAPQVGINTVNYVRRARDNPTPNPSPQPALLEDDEALWSARLLRAAGVMSEKDIGRVVRSHPFDCLLRHALTWQREGGGAQLGPGALLYRIDRGFAADPLPHDYWEREIYLRATGQTADEARARAYVPPGYEELIEH